MDRDELPTMFPTENTPLLQTDRLVLRKFVAEDAAALFQILSDREVNVFLPWFPLETLEQAAAFLQSRFLAYYDKPSAYRYAICLKEDSVPIGYVNVSDEDSHDLGYGLRKEFWHRGIVTEACRALVDRLQTAGLPYITATHDINNPHSGAVMQKMGMTYRYSYKELVQPKNTWVTFRMYQLNFASDRAYTYMTYWDRYPEHFVETNL